MGANAFKKHLGAMRMALELDISTFRELMLKDGKQVVDDLATVLVKHTFDFGSGIDAETKERLQTVLEAEHGEVMHELQNISKHAAAIKDMQTAGLKTLSDLQAYLAA